VERKTQITALATAAEADRRSAAVAKAHIKHCAVCKADYVAQLRAVRSAAFQREVASLIPALPIAESARRDSGPLRDIIADWLSRPFGQDAVVSAGQAASTGIGRGAGGVVAAKIAAVLAAGAATVAITTSVTNDTESRAVPTPTPAATTPTPTATPSPSPTPTATPSPKPTPRPKAKKKQATSAKTQGGTSPTSHEEAPSSAAPQGSLPNGGSEFSPDGASLPPAAPAPVPAAPGSSEFP
jgi:hypothetical protein